MLTVHHLNNSRSQRVIWLLEELGLDYKIEFYKRDSETLLAPDSLKKVHPLGKSPVVTDGSNSRNVAESAVIINYILKVHGNGKFLPAEDAEIYWDFQYWMHYSEGSLMPPLLLNLVFHKIRTGPLPFFVKPIANKICDRVMDLFVTPNLARHTEFIENSLAGKTWICGDELTGADFQMSYPLEAAFERGVINEQKHPNTVAYVKRFQARDAYKSGLEKVGDGKAATW